MDLLGQESGVETPQQDETASDVEDAPVVRFIQKLLIDAINEGRLGHPLRALRKYYRIRFRTDGILREIAQPPLVLRRRSPPASR